VRAQRAQAASGGQEFGAWLPRATPGYRWDWPHLRLVQEHLAAVADGRCRRLMVFMPPRHGKTELVTIRYPVWRLKQNPGCRVILGAYNQTLANKFSRKARRLAVTEVGLSKERAAVEDWETAPGGGMRAVGVGAGITGSGGDLILIDDPVKSREEANSPAYRERVWDWYTDDLYTRLEPGGAIVLIMTRWHTDDLAGRILASEDAGNWTVVNLPAEAEAGDALGRAPGAALCPERFDLARLAEIKTVLGSWAYAALYQQRPAPAEGGMFKREWFAIVDALPAGCTFVRWWDKAATAKGGDYSAGVLLARAADGRFYVADVQRGQWSSDERNRVMAQTAALDAMRRQGSSLEIWMEQEPGSSGKESADLSISQLAGHAVWAETSSGSKEVRAQPLAAQCEAGNVRLLRGAWNAAYIDELTSFPFGANDDQVDASSGAFNKLAQRLWPAIAAMPSPLADYTGI